MKFQIPKGTFDILPYGTQEPWRLSSRWRAIEKIFAKTAMEYGYKEIRTPIFERTELFDRGIGESSDIISKEMFTFLDRAGRSLSLRPEGTASVMRSFLENNLQQLGSVHKFFYIGPMFRYERPQSGRYRQFHQFGVEAIGSSAPEQDAETIDLLCEIYKRVGIKNLKVRLNTVGDPDSRIAFREALIRYLRPHFDQLSEDSKIRFEKNPLRILDSKDSGDRQLLQGAPSILTHLTPAAAAHFQQVCHLLDQIAIPYEIDDKIVRGLDYYNKTVFEVITEDLGAQNTIGAGGRFDGLISSLGGPDLPAIGFATGIERVLQIMEAQQTVFSETAPPLIYFIPLGEEAKNRCFLLATQCRHRNIAAEIDLNAKKVQTGIQNATRAEAVYCAIVGSDELQSGKVQLKHLQSRELNEIALDNLLNHLEGIPT